MFPIEQYRWITLHDFLRVNPFASPEEILDKNPQRAERPEYEIGQRVGVKQQGLHFMIEPEIDESDGVIVCKRKITKEDLDQFRQQEEKMFKPAFQPTVDRVFSILERMYLGRTVYCLHLDELEEDGSDLFFSLPWPWPEHFNGNICSEHGREEDKYNHCTCYRLCI